MTETNQAPAASKPAGKEVVTRILFLLMAAALAAGCGKKAVKKTSSVQPEPPVAVDTVIVDEAPGEAEAVARDKEYSADPELATVRFAYDRAELPEEARRTLRANADVLKKRRTLEVRIAGHCDERGTDQYNLALGQRRANAVRDYYKYLGIAPSRMSTISYGEEAPVCDESTEDCWERNRRAETLARTK
jgi:peptidoglycan-associated lipoprotein